MLQKLLGAVAMGEHLQRVLKPAEGAAFLGEFLAALDAPVLVERVSRDAETRDLVHLRGSDLQFDALVAGTDHRRMQRAIVVLLGRRDIVLEPPRNARPFRMHDAQRAVAVLHLADDDAETENIRQLLEGDGFSLHLAPHGVGRFLAPGHRRLYAARREFLGELLFDALDDAAVLGAKVVQPSLDGLIGLRHQMVEGEPLQFLAQAPHPHAARERPVNVDRFLGDAGALVEGHEMQRAHIVQPVGELDQQHAHVLGDGEQQLAEILALPGLFGDEVELVDLGQALDELADLLAEQAVDLLAGGGGVLDRVVQHGGDDGRVVELEVGQNGRDLERMREIGIARGALLGAMRLHGVDIGPVEQILVDARIIFPHALDEFVLTHHPRITADSD